MLVPASKKKNTLINKIVPAYKEYFKYFKYLTMSSLPYYIQQA